MPRVVGIDHLVLSVGNFARSKEFYDKVLGFLGFKRKYDYADMAGWSNGKTLFWIAAADAQGRKRQYRKGDIGFHHYAFELASRNDVDELGAFLEQNGMTVLDPPGEYYGRNYYAVYFADPDGMKLEGMIWAPPKKPEKAKRKQAARKKTQARKSRSLVRRCEFGETSGQRGAQPHRNMCDHHVATAALGGVERTVRGLDQIGGRLLADPVPATRRRC